jgi:choice-of-anchor B domain-containing protein
MIDIRNPTTPTFAGCYAETLGGGYIHDSQCVVYHGPDQQYQGREICLNSAGEALSILDVTDKQQPKLISVGRYPNVGYTHQGWFTEDQRYFFLDDEHDGRGQATRTIVFDLNDLDDPVVATEFFGTTTAIDHNQYTRGHYVYQSNYSAGLRILDIADPRNPKEVAYLDTDLYGRRELFGFSGAWGAFPYFKSGLIAVSSMGDGLFIVRHRAAGDAP